MNTLSREYQAEAVAFALSHRAVFAAHHGDAGFARMADMLGIPRNLPRFSRGVSFAGAAAPVLAAASFNADETARWHAGLGRNPVAAPVVRETFDHYEANLSSPANAG